MKTWSTSDAPPETGHLVVITEATGGIGYEAALAPDGRGGRRRDRPQRRRELRRKC